MKIAVAVVAVLALMLGTAGTVFGVMEAGKASAEARQISREQATIRNLAARESSLSGHISSLSNQMSSLNAPSDPLSAYDAVCQQDMTNSSSGMSQTYYFPCTNQAQTIPQPSGG